MVAITSEFNPHVGHTSVWSGYAVSIESNSVTKPDPNLVNLEYSNIFFTSRLQSIKEETQTMMQSHRSQYYRRNAFILSNFKTFSGIV